MCCELAQVVHGVRLGTRQFLIGDGILETHDDGDDAARRPPDDVGRQLGPCRRAVQRGAHRRAHLFQRVIDVEVLRWLLEQPVPLVVGQKGEVPHARMIARSRVRRVVPR